MIGVNGTAPDYWRDAHAPATTPGGRPIPRGPAVGTLQEGMGLVAAGRGGMLVCRSTAAYQGRRNSVVFVPVTGLPESVLGVVWHARHGDARARDFAREVVSEDRRT